VGRKSTSKLAFLACSFLALLATEDGYAQEQKILPIVPAIPVIDENGVDLLRLTWTYEANARLFSNIDPDLEFKQFTSGRGYYWSHSKLNFITGSGAANYGNTVVSIGKQSFVFKFQNGSFVDANGIGVSLEFSPSAKRYTFFSRDGTKYIFDESVYKQSLRNVQNSCVADQATTAIHICAFNTSIVYPSQKTHIFTYESVLSSGAGVDFSYIRIRSIKSSTGLLLRFRYFNEGVSDNPVDISSWLNLARADLLNLSQAACDDALCNSASALSSLVFTKTTDSSTKVTTHTITGPGIQVYRFETKPFGRYLSVSEPPFTFGTFAQYENDAPGGARDAEGNPTFVNFVSASGAHFEYRYNNISGSNYYQISGARTLVGGGTTAFLGNQVIPFSDRLLSYRDEENRTTTYQYNDIFRRLTDIILPEGNRIHLDLDSRNNVIRYDQYPKGFAAGQEIISISASYPSQCSSPMVCNKPLSQTDAKSATTEWTYAPEHGGILTETGPAPIVSTIRPQTRYGYALRNAWIKGVGGGYVTMGQPIWLLIRKASCRTTAPSSSGCAGGAADELVTTYDYGPDAGPNNLLLRGVVEDANGAALRTCYIYDAVGNRITEIKPLAGLITCP
jgi:YD repeat-containing protein